MDESDGATPPQRSGPAQRRTEDLGGPGSPSGFADDGRRIIAALPAEQRDQLERSILGRHDLEVRFVTEPDAAVRLAHRRQPSLLLLYDSGLGELRPLIAGLEQSFGRVPFPVIVIAEFPDESYPRAVTQTLPVDTDPATLSTIIAKAVRLPTRARRRHLIRVGVQLDDPMSIVTTGNTVDISASGMLIECTRRLRVGDVHQVSILGVGDVPILSLRLVREAESGHQNLVYTGPGTCLECHYEHALDVFDSTSQKVKLQV